MASRMQARNFANAMALGLLLACGAAAQDRTAVRASLAACGPKGVNFAVSKDKSQHPTPAPETGKARVYLAGDATFAVDGRWIGKSTSTTYFSVLLDPGAHHVCARYAHWLPYYGIIYVWTKVTAYSVHSLDAEAGGVYYFGPQGNPGNPAAIAGFEILQYDSEEGARIVAASKFSTSRPK